MPGTADLNQADPIVGIVNDSITSVTASDLRQNRSPQFVDVVRTACRETGFFCIQPDPEQRTIIARTLHRMQQFFAIDDKDPRKQEVRQDDSRQGWQPRYSEPAYQPGTISSLEAFDLGIGEINGNDRWPSISGFREDVSACWSEYLSLADNALEVLALAAGIEQDFFITRCSSRKLNSMRLLHYTEDLQPHRDEGVGIAAHTDFECITLLYQSAPGLELRNVRGDWFDAPVGNDRIIVLLDDMLERWTNGFFKATGHRVRETDEKRFSIVMFNAVNPEITVEPLDQFISTSSPANYTPVTQAEHLDEEIRRAEKYAERK